MGSGVDTLKGYEGTLLFVSHDRAFLRALGTQVLDLSGERGKGPELYPRSYVEWVERTGHEAPGVHR